MCIQVCKTKQIFSKKVFLNIYAIVMRVETIIITHVNLWNSPTRVSKLLNRNFQNEIKIKYNSMIQNINHLELKIQL